MEEEQRIMDFLSGEMSEPERQAFQKEIDADENLRAAVAHSRHLMNILSKDRGQFSDVVKGVIRENQSEKSNKFYWVAASVAVLMTLIAAVWWQQSDESVIVMADQYMEPYKDILTNRSGADSETDLTDYKNGHYQQAVKSLQQQLDAKYDPVTALYLGVSLLLVEEPSKAIDVFAMIDKGQVVFSDDVAWYQSLAFIKINKPEAAIPLLEILVEEQTVYQQKAEKLRSLIKP